MNWSKWDQIAKIMSLMKKSLNIFEAFLKEIFHLSLFLHTIKNKNREFDWKIMEKIQLKLLNFYCAWRLGTDRGRVSCMNIFWEFGQCSRHRKKAEKNSYSGQIQCLPHVMCHSLDMRNVSSVIVRQQTANALSLQYEWENKRNRGNQLYRFCSVKIQFSLRPHWVRFSFFF